MITQGFEQRSSFVKRLRAIMVAIGLFFLLGMFGIYFSSQGFLQGLQDLNEDNKLLNLTSQILEVLSSSDESLQKIVESSKTKDIRFTFRENQKVIKAQLNESLVYAKRKPDTYKSLISAQSSLKHYEDNVERIFTNIIVNKREYGEKDIEAIKSELLVSSQFAMDAKESLRNIQISLRFHSESLFSNIYHNRFRPLIVTTTLSIIFFSFVMTVGLSSARRLSNSIFNLTKATDAVAQGDLSFRAEIIEKDEIGGLTYEFNHMVDALQDNQTQLRQAIDRVSTLQYITSLFSEALSSHEVYDVIFNKVFKVLGVRAGGVVVLSDDGKNLEVKRVQGYEDAVKKTLPSISIHSGFPIASAVANRKAVYLENEKVIKEQFPETSEIYLKAKIKSSASLPLIISNEIFGGIIFSFSNERTFDQDERDFFAAIAQQCSQALHRSQLYENAQQAILVRDEFLSIASHELRTPLTPLKIQFQGLVRQLKKGDSSLITPERLMKIVESSDRQINRLTNLIDDLLDVSRITSGKLSLSRETVDLSEMVTEVCSQYGHQLNHVNSSILIEKNEKISGAFDKVRIEQVFINLLTNAGKYAAGKPVHVTLTRLGDMAQIIVRDEGNGIDKENQARIFDRFERVRDKDNVGGLGLGLYISKQIVEAHAGRIYVQSELGKGAAFFVELPLNFKESQSGHA